MLGGKGGSAPKVIMLDSADCFAVDALQIEAKHFRSMTTLAYELEQYLPLDAERMTIGIIASGKGLLQNREEGLIVLADRELLEKSILDVETQGIWVAGITPKFLLGCQFWCQENGIGDGHVLWQDGEQDTWNSVKLQNGKPIIWRWLDLKSALADIAKDGASDDVHIVGQISDEIKPIVGESGKPIRYYEASSIDLWASKAEQLWTAGRWSPWLDLRSNIKTRYRNAPIYASLLAFTASLLMILLTSVVYLYWNNSTLNASIATSDVERTESFERLFPHQSVPTDIPGRLTSELRKLESSKQELSKEPPIYSSFPIVVHFLNQLPEEAVFRIDAIRAKSQQLNSVEGSTKSLTDFQVFVSSLRTGGFQFADPSVTQMKDGFSLRLERLTYRSKDSGTAKATSKEARQP